jgi:hypothetical protein
MWSLVFKVVIKTSRTYGEGQDPHRVILPVKDKEWALLCEVSSFLLHSTWQTVSEFTYKSVACVEQSVGDENTPIRSSDTPISAQLMIWKHGPKAAELLHFNGSSTPIRSTLLKRPICL